VLIERLFERFASDSARLNERIIERFNEQLIVWLFEWPN
jgi:hypothetical protein